MGCGCVVLVLLLKNCRYLDVVCLRLTVLVDCSYLVLVLDLVVWCFWVRCVGDFGFVA